MSPPLNTVISRNEACAVVAITLDERSHLTPPPHFLLDIFDLCIENIFPQNLNRDSLYKQKKWQWGVLSPQYSWFLYMANFEIDTIQSPNNP